MADPNEILLALGLFFVLLFGGMWIPFAITTASLLFLYLSLGINGFRGLGLVAWNATDSFKLTAVPLFILMSDLLLRSGVGDRVYRGLSVLVRRLPGQLLQTNILGSAIFAAVSGSSTATAAAIGTVAMPKMCELGYSERLATGSLAAGGTLGILIPPSIAFIVYGSFTETSIAALFMAGVVPGIVMTTLFMSYIGLATLIRPGHAPTTTKAPEPIGMATLISDLFPFTLLIVGVLGGIYTGLVTPTEAAALGAGLAIIIGFTFGHLTPGLLIESLKNATRMTGGIMFIVVAAFLFSFASGMAGVPDLLRSLFDGFGFSRLEFLLVVIVFFVLMGMVMDGMGVLVITIPLLFPLLATYNIDPLWFGVFVVILIEVGMITPPFGMNLFVLQGIRDRGGLEDIAIGVFPFAIIMLGFAIVLVFVPEIALWLPGLTN